MANAEKVKKVTELQNKIKNNKKAIYLLSYKGIKVKDDNLMRRDLKKSGIFYTVEKNTLIKIALHNLGIDTLDKYLSGDTALAVSDDLVTIVKKLKEYENKIGVPKGKAVYFDGQVYEGKDLEAIAKLPSREELLAKVVGGINAPISGLVYTLSGTLKKLVYAINAIKEKKEN